jgi:hypothetical protein
MIEAKFATMSCPSNVRPLNGPVMNSPLGMS